MRNNKKIALILALSLIISLFSACGGEKVKEDKRPIGEIMTEAMNKSLEIKSAHQTTDINLQMTVPEEIKSNPMAAGIVPMLENSNISINQDYLVNENEALAYIHAALKTKDSDDAMFSGDLYLLPENKIAVQTPFYPQIITADLKELQSTMEEQSGEKLPYDLTTMLTRNSDELKKYMDLSSKLYGIIFNGVEENSRGLEKVSLGDKEQELNVFTFTYKSNEDILVLIEKIAKNLLESDKLYDLMQDDLIKESVMQAAKSSGESFDFEEMPSKEEFDKERAEALEKFDEEFAKSKEEMAKFVNFNELTLKLGFNKEGYIVYSNIIFDAVVKNEGMEIPLKVTMDANISDINKLKKEDIKTIDVNENNSVDFMQLLSMGM